MQIASIRRLRGRLHASLRNESEATALKSAVVFAPHQDDETLGCGGTMLLKTRAATPLTCVFMTDGATSHRQLMDENELRRLRRHEALEATGVLGLREEQVQFLDFPDSKLGDHHRFAVARVAELLARLAPEEVYVPYQFDGTPDHEATYRIVIDALRSARRVTRVLEYPIWFWNRWPWVPLPLSLSRQTLDAVRAAVAGRFGLIAREFQYGVYVGSVVESKRQALAMHRSQMSVIRPGTSWPTLKDVSRGEFLDCFFDDFEVFRSSMASPVPSASKSREA